MSRSPVYRPARSEKVIGMTILGARVVLVLRAQAAYPGPANTHSPLPTRYPTISRGSSKPSRPEPRRTKLAQLGCTAAPNFDLRSFSVPNPGPGCQVHRRLRCRVHWRRHPHPAHTSAGAPSQRDRRTMDRHPTPPAARPNTDPQPTPPRTRPNRVHNAFQPAPPPPSPAIRSTTQTTPTALVPARPSPPASRPARRTHPRIRPSRMTWMTNSAPTGSFLTELQDHPLLVLLVPWSPHAGWKIGSEVTDQMIITRGPIS